MSIFTLISNLVHSLAWPVATLVIVFLLRRNIANIFDRVLEAKIGKYVTVKLEGATKLLKESRRELHAPEVNLEPAAERPLTRPATRPPQIVTREEVSPLLLTELKIGAPPDSEEHNTRLDPSVQVEAIWKELSRDLLLAARSSGLSRARKLERAVAHLVENGLVPMQFQSTFENVQAVYKAIQRHPNLPIDAVLASEFMRTCNKLLTHLTQISIQTRN